MTDLPRYRSHKIVQAAPIAGWSGLVVCVRLGEEQIDNVVVPANFFARGVPKSADYLVVYADGDMSWSPRQAFEDGYTLLRARVEE